MRRLRIEIAGVVQGVGFRPFVYGLAKERNLGGFVRNSSAGVEIEIEGVAVEAFVEDLRSQAPPLSDILSLEVRDIPLKGEREFSILPSRDDGESTFISPDVSICGDCLREMLDPADRRFLYPFINCTNCGPRYSLTRRVPYDRPNTTMAAFEMCGDCDGEYHDPLDRRFHAQPNACPLCGPRAEFRRGGESLQGKEAVDGAVALLAAGGILAVKGVGGYHLAVDAANAEAVERLRERKRKSNKAFALMAPDLAAIRRFAEVSAAEEALLLSRERPIVLLKRSAAGNLPGAVAPGVPELGFMLPYSPLHALLFFQRPEGKGRGQPNFPALVMTSGNRSEEPVAGRSSRAEKELGPFVDAFLHHDREIFMRVDDSVLRHFDGQTVFLRRARGYVPSAIPLPGKGPKVLACGADLKNTFCLTTQSAAVVSQHIGDMENFETLEFFEETLRNLRALYRVEPEAIAHDLHPGYFSTRWALEQEAVEKHGIQHHFAHVASVMAEKGLEGPVIGVALDGSGYGGDGTVWGGEFLVADGRSFERRAHFRPLPMPGGEAAARNPWQMALSFLDSVFGDGAPKVAGEMGLTARRGREEIANVLAILGNSRLSPLTSGAGRLFEAFAALLGVGDVNTYEGEAAMALEGLAGPPDGRSYPYDGGSGDRLVIDFSGTLRAVVRDKGAGADLRVIAAKIHVTVAAAVTATALRISGRTGITDVALSGGVFQNRLLLGLTLDGLRREGLKPHFNTSVPPNDAGISLGQAFILRNLLKG
jgi:hydrogenase maturation protein HypF